MTDLIARLREAANLAYRICAETRHVTLGDKVRDAIMALDASDADTVRVPREPTEAMRRAGGDHAGSNALAAEIWAAMLTAAHPKPEPVETQRKPVCANCKGMFGDLAGGREPEELCDTCYEHSQEATRETQPEASTPSEDAGEVEAPRSPVEEDRATLIAELAPLVEKAAGPNGWGWMFPLAVKPVDGKPTIVAHKGGNLFRGYIGTWQEADLLVALANAAPRILAALSNTQPQAPSEERTREHDDRVAVEALSDALKQIARVRDETRHSDDVPERERVAMKNGAVACWVMVNGLQGEILNRYPIRLPARFATDTHSSQRRNIPGTDTD